MKLKLILLILAVMLVFGVGIATATSSYDLQINQGGPVDVTGQSTVLFDVVFNVQGTLNLGTYSFSLFYDAAELTWNSGLTTTYAPTPLFPQILGDLDGTTAGYIFNFNSGSFGFDASLSAPFTLAQVGFDVVSPVLDGSADVWFDQITELDMGFSIDSSFVHINDMPTSGPGPDVYATVVPEPISAALFIIGGAALGFRRFRKSITN